MENQDVPEDWQEVVLFAPDKECQKQDKTVLPIVETPKKQVKRKITHEDVLEQQYKALIAKQENLQLKKKKIRIRSVPFGTKSVLHSCTSVNKFKSIKFVELKFLHFMDLNSLTLL